LLAFNGQWRPGPDSALYRGLARDLAERGTYTVNGLPEPMAYPGLPWLLTLFGEAAWPVIVAMNLCAVLALVLTYRLARTVLPAWAATWVTLAVGLNALFVQHAQEILTDVPFLVAVLLVFVGVEQWGRKGAAVVAIGFAMAIVLRPTAWVVVAAFGVVGIGRLAAGRWWRWHLGVAATVVVIGGVLWLLDPRQGGGGYLSRVIEAFGEVWRLPGNLSRTVGRELNQLFYSETMSPLPWLFGLPVVAAMIVVGRRRPVWGVTCGVLMLVMIASRSVSRYYLMVLPMIWIGWVLMSLHLAAWLGRRTAGRGDVAGWALTVLLLFPVVMNVSGLVNLIAQQRQRPFLTHHGDGRYATLKELAEAIAAATEPGEVTIGPSAHLLAWWSRRPIVGDLRAADPATPGNPADRLMAFEPTWIVGPPVVYDDDDEWVRGILRRHELYLDKPSRPLDAQWSLGQPMFLATPRPVK
jgi:4-amino-4-deoxy-L-arabinose transferase-like glycosyltransferase